MSERCTHWTEPAERVRGSDALLWGHLAEDDWGDLWVPSWTRKTLWDRRFSPWRPTHWPYWLRSRLTRKLAFVEAIR